MRSGGHNLYGLSHPECLDHLEQRFIERGTLAGLDTTCAAQMTRPGFCASLKNARNEQPPVDARPFLRYRTAAAASTRP
jgi:hypothetical protein